MSEAGSRVARTTAWRWVPAVLAGLLAVPSLSGAPAVHEEPDPAPGKQLAAAVFGEPVPVLPAEPELPPEPEPEPPASRTAFEARYPEQAAAVETATAAGRRWALLIGINRHQGGVADNIGSRQDAELLRGLLLEAGWQDDHIVLITDADATGVMIREGLAWLERKTTFRSEAVFHYSGHSRKWYGAGGRIDDIALWPTDHEYLKRGELAASLGQLLVDRMWINVATCNAGALDVAGITGTDRIATFSSAAAEKSYEDPAVGHSVWGSYLLADALAGASHRSVQDAFAAAAPQATALTEGQVPYGAQRPVLVDGLGAPFELRVPVDGPGHQRTG